MARSVRNACAENSFFAGAMNCEVICWVNVGAGMARPTGDSTPRAANELAMVLLYMWRGRDIVKDARTLRDTGDPANCLDADCTPLETEKRGRSCRVPPFRDAEMDEIA
jgi:hypothetical protein